MFLRMILVSGVFALFLCGSSCEDTSGPSEENNNQTGDDPSFGSFQVNLVAPQGSTPGFTSVLGRLYDGPSPEAVIWEQAATSGACRLMTPRVPFCQQSCGGTAMCVEDDSCQAYPTAVTVGTVQVDGLQTTSGETSFTMDPIASNYQPVGITLAYPAFSEGDIITFTASGEASTSAFTVTATGISPLEILNGTIDLIDGQPINLQWTPPAQADIASISVVVDISHHGGTKGLLECDAPDTGALEIPANLLDQLKALGMSGFPKIEVTRKSVGTNASAMTDLIIKSMVTKSLEIPGLVSCSGDEDCPAGQTCAWDLRCQ
ncbi:hypothetical protein ACFL5V_03495 [Fibrobacterota bacterium]